MIPLVAENPTVSIADVATQLDVQAALKAAKQKASPCVIKGIDAMIQMAEGRSARKSEMSLGCPPILFAPGYPRRGSI